VQDAVEKTLIEEGHAKTAKAYILYRKQHTDIREIGGLLKDIDVVDGYLSMMDWKVKENSNMSYSLQGLNVYATENIVSNYWLHKIFPPEIGDAHTNGQVHVHDLGTLGAYCVGWDLKDILLMGFKGVSGKIESKPAKHFGTALMQIVNYLYTLQGEAAGAQALSNFDTLLAPFIKKDGLDYNGVKQEIQKFLFNMNVPTRVGFQSPFTNITMDLTVPSYMIDEPIIIGGELMDDNYSDYIDEMNMMNHAFAEIMYEGDAKERPFTFPIPTYNITKDFDWNSDGLKPLWKMTAKYGIPYFSNFINSDMKPDDARSMCCRLRLDNRELRKRGGGLFGANPKTGSIGVVTMNMPRIGYLAKNDDDYFERLDDLMVLAKQSLEIKREIIENLTESGLHPYSRVYLADVKKTFGEYWKNHFATIGLIGMNDSILNFLNKSIADPEGKMFAEKVLDYMRNRMADFQEETGNIYNLEATPAEGTSYRLARIDKTQYPDIRTYNQEIYSNNGGRDVEPYYTNSSQLPVGYTTDVFEALELQDSLQSKYTGGTVLHIFLGEEDPSHVAIKKLVRKVAENYSLPYYTITPTFSICPVHGYLPGEKKYCPKCDKEIGYIGGN
jgi:ribonucleoside-triphosphate reductase